MWIKPKRNGIKTETETHNNKIESYVHGLVEQTDEAQNSVDCWPWDVRLCEAKCACVRFYSSGELPTIPFKIF